ncbi:thiamine phosphate synthase [uncultured Methylophaga sp.]|uniref:thiamine phosphate synthase n=1 Tax=uncultured Methylophaga sp. TaxID=285271 RepID=UPI0026174C1E|nr:thiamine phosphate synthase [uncultured Methylophaga sp.]
MTTQTRPAVLLIGGLDPQGCAGIAADIATVQHHDCHALPLITAMTEQRSTGLTDLGAVNPQKLLAQFADCQRDFEVRAVKIGLIPSLSVAEAVIQILAQLPGVPVVLDPVLASSSGGVGVSDEVQQYLLAELLPAITLLTPNLKELRLLSGDHQSIELAANHLRQTGLNACLVKGGHSDGDYASDYFQFDEGGFYCYQNRLEADVRGTGCVLASATAAHLASGQDIRDAVVLAKAYVHRGIRQSRSAGPYAVMEHSRESLTLEDMPRLCYKQELIGKQFEFPACPPRLGIYPVVDSHNWVEKLVNEGIETIQLRVKEQSAEHTREQINASTGSLNGRAVNFFVNDHWQLAIEAGAYGVHLGQEDLHDANLAAIAEAGLRLGISTHSYWELARALAVNPSYIALGPIYETTSKQMPFSPQGLERLQQWVNMLQPQYPVVAIGGINQQRAAELKPTGVGSVAMITAITLADDYRRVTRELLSLWQS